MPSTVGARSVEKQEHFCIIQEISCEYESRGKQKAGVLYQSNGSIVKEEKIVSVEADTTDGTLTGVITNDFGRYYVISNNDGIEVEIICDTNANSCDDDCHKKVEIYAPDISSKEGELRCEVRSITEKKLKVYYYNLFRRSEEWGIVVPYIPAAAMAGEAVDFLSTFRFFLLPELKSVDTQLVYDLQYHDCLRSPNIFLDVYPDIEYSVNIGFEGVSRKLKAGIKPTDTENSRNYSFSFIVKYGSIKKEFNYNTYESLEKEANNNFLYKTLRFIGRFLYDTGNFAESLSKEIEGVSDANATNIGRDMATIGRTDKVIGKTLVRARRWLSGSFSIQPMFSLSWAYETSDDLRQLLRHIQLSLSAECSGELKIDLVEIYLHNFRKLRKVTTLGALVATIGSGGLAAIVSALIKFIIDCVITWVINKVKEGLKFNLILIGKVDIESLSYDSLSETKVEGLKVIVNPEIRLELGVDAKASITLFIFKASVGVGGSAKASTSLKWELALNSSKRDLGIDHDMAIYPFNIKVGVYALGSFEISMSRKDSVSQTMSDNSSFGYSSEKKKDWSHEWNVKKITCEMDRWVLFKYDKSQEVCETLVAHTEQ